MAVTTGWRGYWTSANTELSYHELDLELKFAEGKAGLELEGSGKQWSVDDSSPETVAQKRKKIFDLKPHCANDGVFRQTVERTMHQHSSAPIPSRIRGTVDHTNIVELVESWEIPLREAATRVASVWTNQETSLQQGKTRKLQFGKAGPKQAHDEQLDENSLVTVNVKYFGVLDWQAECISGFRSDMFRSGGIVPVLPANLERCRPDLYATKDTDKSSHPWRINGDKAAERFHPFKVVFSRTRNLQAYSRTWTGFWRFVKEEPEKLYDTSQEVSVSPEGIITGCGQGHQTNTGFLIYGLIDQTLRFTWRKIYATYVADYRADTSDYQKQVDFFEHLRGFLVAAVHLPRDVCWSIFEYLGTTLVGQWDNVESQKMGPFELRLPVVESPQSQSLVHLLGRAR